MNFLGYYSDFLKFTFETVLACVCFVGGMERRSHFPLRCVLALLAIMLLTFPTALLAAWFELGDYGTFAALIYTLLSAASYCLILGCYKDSIWNLLFCCVSGTMIRMCTKKIFDIVLIGIQLSGGDVTLFEKGSFFRYLLFYPIFFIIYFIIYMAFRNVFRKGHLLTLNSKLFSIYIVVMGINLILNNLEPVLIDVDVKSYVLLVFCEMTYYILILCMQSFLFQMAQARLEAHDMQELWKKDKHQYELMKENIEIINIMCHDLRHQIRSAGEHAQLPAQFIQELEHSISVYDSTFQTGNQTFDVILTDKHLRCDIEKIQFTCIADGKKLNFINHSDLISLFENALENALEYEMTVPDIQNRFINLLVRQKADFLIINVENYFEGELVIKDGYPVTHKHDKAFHGYGLKSIHRIVKKYNGTMNFSTEGNTFFLNLVFPLPIES